VARVAKAPLLFAPGSAWRYSIASDVLGAVLAAASGADLPDLVRTLVTDPLGMAATGFHVDPDIVVATPYVAIGGSTRRMQDPESLPFFESPIVYSPSRCFDAGAWPSGGTGMVSTAPDFLSLIDALCAGGAPLLPPATVAQLGRNAIGALDSGAGPGRGWGLAGAVVTDPAAAGLPGHAGSWGWGGVYGTHFFVDPAAALSVVCMTNTALTGMIGAFPDALRVAVYQDLADG
jgi:CubicO group peptidase (beta-lactamase class C family)